MRSLREVVHRRRELAALCDRQRRELSSLCAPLAMRLGVADSVLGAARHAVRSPVFWAVSAGVAATAGPRRLIRLLRRGIALWQGALIVLRVGSVWRRLAHME